MIYHRVISKDTYKVMPKAWIIRSYSGNLFRVWVFGRYWEFGWKPFVWARPIATYTEELAWVRHARPQVMLRPPHCEKCGAIVGSRDYYFGECKHEG